MRIQKYRESYNIFAYLPIPRGCYTVDTQRECPDEFLYSHNLSTWPYNWHAEKFNSDHFCGFKACKWYHFGLVLCCSFVLSTNSWSVILFNVFRSDWVFQWNHWLSVFISWQRLPHVYKQTGKRLKKMQSIVTFNSGTILE